MTTVTEFRWEPGGPPPRPKSGPKAGQQQTRVETVLRRTMERPGEWGSVGPYSRPASHKRLYAPVAARLGGRWEFVSRSDRLYLRYMGGDES